MYNNPILKTAYTKTNEKKNIDYFGLVKVLVVFLSFTVSYYILFN